MIPSVMALAAELSRERPEPSVAATAVATMMSETHPSHFQAELQLMQAQVQPHFVVHALQAVSARLTHDALAASTMLVALGNLLRASLEQMHTREVPLRAELVRLEQYLNFQRVRLRDRLVVQMNVSTDTLDAHVPPLFLQSLVERTLFHTVEHTDQIVTVAVRTARHGDELHVDLGGSGALMRVVVPFRTVAAA